MNNYKLTIQYDGSKYKGWQRLKNSDNTIQGKIENVLSLFLKNDTEIIGCSRTDAGVHALKQIANFKTEINVNIDDLINYLNHYLPEDISIVDISKVAENFHSRYNAKNKTYVYKIWNKNYSEPFQRKYSFHIKENLDIEKMKKASEIFIGTHDFTAFTSAVSKSKSMVRTIYNIGFKENNGMIEIRYTGDGFLHNMVRRITGAIIEAGLNKFNLNNIKTILDAEKNHIIGATAPSLGLFLENIEF